jgi:hypothetical protein
MKIKGTDHQIIGDFMASPKQYMMKDPRRKSGFVIFDFAEGMGGGWKQIAQIYSLPRFLVFCRLNFAGKLKWPKSLATMGAAIFFAGLFLGLLIGILV